MYAVPEIKLFMNINNSNIRNGINLNQAIPFHFLSNLYNLDFDQYLDFDQSHFVESDSYIV